LLNFKTYKISYILLIFLGLQGLRAESQVVAETNDSIRQFLFLKSHLLVRSDELSPLLIDSLLQSHVPLAIWSSGNTSNFAKELVDRMPGEILPLVIISEKKPESLDDTNPKLLILDRGEVQKHGTANGQSGHSSLLWVETLPDSLWQLDRFMEIWELSGRLPNFISVTPGKVRQTANIVGSLNNQPKIFGVVRNADRLLTDVSWKDFPSRKTNGYFSFPVLPFVNSALAPYKPGYRFSPDIVLPSPENLRNLKVFNAIPLDPDFGLTDQFTFSHKVRNQYRQNDSEIILSGLDFVKDPEHGNCAFFSGKAYVDGGLKSRSALKSNFSITAWIKPTELNDNNCILAKGKDFVLKIHQGKLTFTVQGVKDYYSVKTPIPVNRWSFISLVHSEADNHIRYYLNGELTEQIQLLTRYLASDYTMLIGSNLWEEFFEGYMSEIKIWERELNDEEIRNEFRKESEVGSSLKTSWVLGIFLFLGALGLGIRRWLFPPKTHKTIAHNTKTLLPVTPEVREPNAFQEQISCFGGLKVINSEGKDISLKFSPKIKQLFVLILLHSVGGRKGISSNKLSDCLWPGMSPQNAKNIRGTNIQNLKALLTSCSGIKLVFQDKLWMLEFSGDYFIDYAFVEEWLKEKDTADVEMLANKLPELLPFLKRGILFANMSESWVDPYIEQMSNRIIEFGLNLFHLLPEGKHDALLLDVAEVISINDPLNEPSLRKKISILTRQGKLGIAHSVFDNFIKLYFELYQEKYPGDFKSMMVAND